MIVTAHRSEQHLHPRLFDEMFKLRATLFLDRRKWDVKVTNGREIDAYDDMDPLYVMSVSNTGRLVASLRLLPTSGPHMLADVFPETMTGAPIIRHPLIWESSRFCVDTNAVAEQTKSGINVNSCEVLLGMFEIAHKNAVTDIVSVYDVFVERILRRVGCPFDRLGEPFAYDGLKTVAGVSPTRGVSKSIRDKSGITGDIFARNTKKVTETVAVNEMS